MTEYVWLNIFLIALDALSAFYVGRLWERAFPRLKKAERPRENDLRRLLYDEERAPVPRR